MGESRLKLSGTEEQQFRVEYDTIERDVQRSIAIYLSALVVVIGWIARPAQGSLADMMLGNGGYNIYGVITVGFINTVFALFLAYKGLVIQELMQFVAYHSAPHSSLREWERWRRSPIRSVARPVRSVYFLCVGGLPLAVSMTLFAVAGVAVFGGSESIAAALNASSDVSTRATDTLFSRAYFSVAATCSIAIAVVFVRASTVTSRRMWRNIQDPDARDGSISENI